MTEDKNKTKNPSLIYNNPSWLFLYFSLHPFLIGTDSEEAPQSKYLNTNINIGKNIRE